MSEQEDRNNQVDYETAWHVCGQSGEAPQGFRDQVDECLTHYHWKRVPSGLLTARECNRHFDKLSKQANNLLQLLAESERRFLTHLWEAYGSEFEDSEEGHQDFSELVRGTENEGLEYFDVQMLQLKPLLTELSKTAKNAAKFNQSGLGRPSLNYRLEQAIVALSQVYMELTGAAPGRRMTIDSTVQDTPFKGPFIDFVTTILWSHAGKKIPSNSVIGEAARKALGLRK